MPDDGSVTGWINELRDGSPDAAHELWRRYFRRIQNQARRYLGQRREIVFDSEDIAVGAFEQFYRLHENGNFPELTTRDELWPLLVQITTNKAREFRRKEQAQKRQGVRQQAKLDEIAHEQQAPDFEVMMAEECQRLLGLLNDPLLVDIALLKLDGCTNEEVGIKTNYTRRTIQRALNVIRAAWQREVHAT